MIFIGYPPLVFVWRNIIMQSEVDSTSKKKDAVVVVCDNKQILVIALLTKSAAVEDIVMMDNEIGDDWNHNFPVGLYFAHCDITVWGDEHEYDHEWIIGDPIYVMSPDYLESLKRGQ